MNFKELYSSRVQKYLALEEEHHNLSMRYSMIRLILFIIGAVISIFCFSVNGILGFVVTAVLLFGFSRFVAFHKKIKEKEIHYQNLKSINTQELNRLTDDLEGIDDGERFLDPGHPYSADLDIFGEYSVFQYFNRAVTSIGKQTHAEMLSESASLEEIEARQEATKELAEKLDWIQDFQAIGLHLEDEPQHLDALKNWLNDQSIMLGNKLLIHSLWLVPLVVFGSLFIPAEIIPWRFKWLILIIPGIILKQRLEEVNDIHRKTNRSGAILRHYAKIIQHIENEKFTSPKLKMFHEQLMQQDKKASDSLGKLSYIIRQLNVRNNFFAIFLNLLFLWDLYYVLRLEQWKKQHKDGLLNWFESLKWFDALNSYGMIAFNHPDWIYPEVRNQNNPLLEAVAIGHPLIRSQERVDNDLSIPHSGHIKLITGSNMAGKSTFLRSMGLGIVFATVGLPVCAKRFATPNLQVYTSMRTKDALHENTSSFYAELKRLKYIIEVVEEEKPVFFLLDEILKGTNSHDRHNGSKALIKQLVRSKGVGLIATHDLELGYLGEESPKELENLCFEVDVKGELLDFDYKIKKGVCQSLNASILMKKMGIRM